MGCDIHVYFETRAGDGWRPTWPPVPHDRWWERILEDKVETQAAHVFTGCAEDNAARTRLRTYFEAMPREQIVAEFGAHSEIIWHWPLPGNYHIGNISHEFNVMTDRDYCWFARLAGVRGDLECMFSLRGLPADASDEVKKEARQWEGGHNRSWLLVEEILAKTELVDFGQYKWLAKHVADPANTRIVFWFDN